MKRARVLDAEAAKAELVLAAEANKESQILEATGKAEAIRLVAEADSKALNVAGTAAITAEGSVIATYGKTSDNIGNTVAQAIAVSSALKLSE